MSNEIESFLDQQNASSDQVNLIGEHVLGLINQGNNLSIQTLRSALWVTAQSSPDSERKKTATELLKNLSFRS